MRKISAAVVFCLHLCISAGAQAPAERAVDSFLRSEMERQKIPGVALAVIKDGKPLVVKGFGFANLEHQVPVKPETIFQSGSVGKQFTAAAIMLLVEDGRIALDEKISKYLEDVPEGWKNITVRHLLTHTNGLASYPEDFDFRRDYTEDELWSRIKQVSPAFQPGERWRYSNLGYATLGLVIRRVTGKFYGDFLHERVFRSLGMTTTRVITEADIVPNRAAGYRLVDGGLKNQEWVSPTINTTADGSLYLSVLDMMKWDSAWHEDKLLTKQSKALAWTPIMLSDGTKAPYGFGWEINVVNGRRLIEHGGTWQGFESHISKYVDDDLSVIVFANLRGARVRSIAHDIAAIVDPDLTPKSMADNEPATTARHLSLLRAMIDGTADRSLFTPAGAEAIFPLVEKAREQMKALGAIEKIEVLDRRSEPVSKTNLYRVVFNNARTLYTVILKDGKITSMDLKPE